MSGPGKIAHYLIAALLDIRNTEGLQSSQNDGYGAAQGDIYRALGSDKGQLITASAIQFSSSIPMSASVNAS
jgi:hypothetical protein